MVLDDKPEYKSELGMLGQREAEMLGRISIVLIHSHKGKILMFGRMWLSCVWV